MPFDYNAIVPNFSPMMLLHGEQYLEIRQWPLPTSGRLVSRGRHSGATHAEVDVELVGRLLRVIVRDDGLGGASRDAGSGCPDARPSASSSRSFSSSTSACSAVMHASTFGSMPLERVGSIAARSSAPTLLRTSFVLGQSA